MASTNDNETKTESQVGTSSNKDESKADDQETSKFPIKVFLRIRPLIKDEIENKHDMISYDCAESKQGDKKTIILKNIDAATGTEKEKGKGKGKGKGKLSNKELKYTGFSAVVTPKDDNKATFSVCIEPSLSAMLNGKTVCCFAYGHTGSGKTHTMLGKYDRNVPGMFELTANYLFKEINKINSTIKDDNDKILIEMQFGEIYKKKIRDLFCKDNKNNKNEAFIREGNNGFVVRGPTIKDNKTGKVKVTPLTSISARTSDQVLTNVIDALSRRNVGNSTLHDESSRSHAFLSFELITQRMYDCRMEIIEKESDIVPVGKKRDDMKIEVAVAGAVGYKKDDTSGEWVIDPDFVPTDEQKELLKKRDELEVQVAELEAIYEKECDKLKDIIKNSNKCVTGTILFVDLAGNEYGSDVYSNVKKITQAEMKEMKEINKSLLALKECIRKMHDGDKHIPFRDSIITKVLKRHLIGDDSNGIMIANLSSSQQHVKKTINTLKYTQLVGIA